MREIPPHLVEYFSIVHCCEVCGERLSRDFAPHHRHPKARGGTDEIKNLCALCLKCHARYTDIMGQLPYQGTDSFKLKCLARNVNKLCKINGKFWRALPEYAQDAFEHEIWGR